MLLASQDIGYGFMKHVSNTIAVQIVGWQRHVVNLALSEVSALRGSIIFVCCLRWEMACPSVMCADLQITIWVRAHASVAGQLAVMAGHHVVAMKAVESCSISNSSLE